MQEIIPDLFLGSYFSANKSKVRKISVSMILFIRFLLSLLEWFEVKENLLLSGENYDNNLLNLLTNLIMINLVLHRITLLKLSASLEFMSVKRS